MNCPACGGAMPEVTIGIGEDALTMGSCDRCSKRFWHQHGEVIDLREALGAIGNRATARKRPQSSPTGSSPVGTTTAVELLRAGLAGRHVVAALKKELALDERQAHAALTAAEWSQLTLT